MSTKSRVAVVSCHKRDVAAGRVIDIIGMPDIVRKRVFVKPNYNSAHAAPGSTHIDTLRTAVEAIKSGSPESITVGDRSGMGDTRKVMETCGVFDLADELGFKTVVLDELPDDSWEHFNPEGDHWAGGYRFAKPPLEADSVFSLCCLKTHGFGGHFTMSLKNAVGMVHRGNMRELHTSIRNQRKMIAEINVHVQPVINIIDGVEAFVGGGPHKGTSWKAGLTLASTDRVALDAVGVAALKMHGTTGKIEKRGVFEQEQIKRAVELGLGASCGEEIELVSDDEAGEEVAVRLVNIIEK